MSHEPSWRKLASKYHWSLASPQPELAKTLARAANIPPLLAQCLLNRGLSEPGEISRFLLPQLKNLSDPFLLPDMEVAVQRLYLARERRESVVVFGDYDVDGVTATAVLTEIMGALGWKTDCYLPHRMEEGYGLSQAGVENCLNKFPTNLLIAVDCGSSTPASIEWLQQQGVDVIVLDHHQISDPPPRALALINPRRGNGSETNFQELCSAGLAFKLAHALVKRGRELGLQAAVECDIRGCLDLVALGTVADMVPLMRENRILVKNGLERLTRSNRLGLQALKQVAGIARQVGSYEVGYQLAPRLNAAGRLETALAALELLQARDMTTALMLAQRLDAQNRGRQDIERAIAAEAIQAIRRRFKAGRDFVIVEGNANWHIGVVGIVASRVLQEFYRPTIILGGDGPVWRGSGRSIEGFDLAAALRECADLLLRHGGHAMAAGVTIDPENLSPFRSRLNDLAQAKLKPDQLQPTLRLDAEITVSELNWELMQELEKLEHTGMGNPPVQLLLRDVTHQREPQRIGADKKHAKMWITDGCGMREAVIWGLGTAAMPSGHFDLACTPELNEYNGTINIQLKVLDWRPAQ